MLLVTIPMHWIRHQTFEENGVRSNTRGFCVFFTLLFYVLLIVISVLSENKIEAALNGAFAGTLLWMAEIDARTQLLPDRCNLMIFVIAILRQIVLPQGSILSGLLGCVVISVPMFVLCMFIDGAFGGGDIKLTAAWGFFLGWKLAVVAACLAILAGGAYGAYLLIAKKKERKAHFAFGPFLCLGAIAATFVGEELINWYLGLYL